MKEYEVKKVGVELEPAEDEAFEVVLNVLERMSYIFEEQGIDIIFLKIPQVGEVEIVEGMEQRAIQALEEILGIWH